jgi:glycosyltransferase involved in cell wall biosynthesis
MTLLHRSITISANAIPLQGGQGLNLYHMIEGARGSFDITLFCSGANGEVRTQFVPQSRISTLIGSVPFLRRLRDWQVLFSDNHFDGYVAKRLNGSDIFQGATGQCLESLGAARGRGCRTLLDVVTMHIDDFGAQQDRECLRFQVRPATHARQRERIRLEYDSADLIRVMSERARQTFLRRGYLPERVVAVTPPINLAEFPQARFAEPKFRVSCVGLIEPWKGFHYLIDAFNALNLADSELVLWGGSGTRSVTHYLQKQMVRNRAIVVKPVETRSYGYGEVYGKSSVLVHPSLTDGFGYVVAEAMASGIPVIVTSSTGAADLIVDGQNGYIVPPGDSDAIRDRLAHLAAHPALMREMGCAARETARSLTYEKFRRRYALCLDALIA